jgi:hypothetical protein
MRQLEKPLSLDLDRSQVERVIQALDCAIDHAEQEILSADRTQITLGLFSSIWKRS